MEKIKKYAKEFSVFGIVLIAFVGLFIYRSAMYGDYTILSTDKAIEKIKDKDTFVLVVGNNTENETYGYLNTMKSFVNETKNDDLYFVNLADIKAKEVEKLLVDTLASDEVAYPQTFAIVDGKVEMTRKGAQSYYRINEFTEKLK